MTLSKGALTEKRNIEIKRNKETELDLKDVCATEEEQYGNLIFAVTPKEAEVYMDGEYVDISMPYQTEYGIHQLMVRAKGYQTVIQYIKVGQENATIQVTLQEQKEDSVSSNQIKNPDTSDSATSATGGTLTISGPEGAELYMDGNYIGIIPKSVKKTKGVHVIVLRKSGYETRSYTINIEDEKTDQTMSFSELVKSREEQTESKEEKPDSGDDQTEKNDGETDRGKETEKSVSNNEGAD